MISLQDPANEQSTYPITVNFYDEFGNETTPSSLTWTLTDVRGNVINLREDVAVVTPGTEEVIVLSGDDLKTNGSRTELVLTTNAVYDSVNGSDLPVVDEIRFWVNNLLKKGSGD